jgi:hypothetical protein
MEPEIQVVDEEETLDVRIHLLLPTAPDFPKILSGHPPAEFLRDWMGRGIHPIGVISEEGSSEIVLGVAPQRQLVALFDDQSYPVESPDAGKALFRALDAAAFKLWGHSWNSAVGEIFGVNRRTTQRDRVARNLLPPKVLYMIAYLASLDDGPAMASALLSVAGLHNAAAGNEGAVRSAWQFAIDAFYGTNDEGLRVTMAPEKP